MEKAEEEEMNDWLSRRGTGEERYIDVEKS